MNNNNVGKHPVFMKSCTKGLWLMKKRIKAAGDGSTFQSFLSPPLSPCVGNIRINF